MTTDFETPRLRVRRFTGDDVEPFVSYRTDPEVARHHSWSDYTLEQGRALVESLQDSETGCRGSGTSSRSKPVPAARSSATSRCTSMTKEPRQAEVGFTSGIVRTRVRAWRARRWSAFLDWLFPTFRLHRIIAVTDVLNAPLARLLERVGMRRQAHFHRQHLLQGCVGQRVPPCRPRGGVGEQSARLMATWPPLGQGARLPRASSWATSSSRSESRSRPCSARPIRWLPASSDRFRWRNHQ